MGALLFSLVFLSGCLTDGELAETPTVEPEAAPKQKIVIDPEVLKLAERAADQERYDDARQILQRVLLNDPDNTHAALILSEILLAEGQAAAASPRFDEIIKSEAFRARALQGKGRASLWLGEPETAAGFLQQAVTEDPTLWRAWNTLGYYYDTTGEWAAAEEAYTRALAIRPKNAAIHNNRGYSYLLQGRTREAIDDLSAAVRLDPDLSIAQQNLRLAMASMGRYQHAVLGVDKKDMPRVLNNVGFMALLRGDYSSAEALLLRAVDSDAGYNAAAYRNLAYLENLRKIKDLEMEMDGPGE